MPITAHVTNSNIAGSPIFQGIEAEQRARLIEEARSHTNDQTYLDRVSHVRDKYPMVGFLRPAEPWLRVVMPEGANKHDLHELGLEGKRHSTRLRVIALANCSVTNNSTVYDSFTEVHPSWEMEGLVIDGNENPRTDNVFQLKGHMSGYTGGMLGTVSLEKAGFTIDEAWGEALISGKCIGMTAMAGFSEEDRQLLFTTQ